jgi:hypothetical protein
LESLAFVGKWNVTFGQLGRFGGHSARKWLW